MITLIAEPCVSKDEHARRINNLPFLLCLQKLMENILDSRSMTPKLLGRAAGLRRRRADAVFVLCGGCVD